MSTLFTASKALDVFGTSVEQLAALGVNQATLPAFSRSSSGRPLKSWSLNELALVGEKIGFMKKPTRTVVASVFVTKGGVLKSSLSLNFARMAALHGIRTCVIGLDMQSDVTTALSGEDTDESESIADAVQKMNAVQGLADLFTGEAALEEIVKPTDIPTLFYIPETPELVALDSSLVQKNRREYWLSENVVQPLKHRFDLIVLDCSPNWNRLITNALVASDILISPVECKINNFRNLSAFRALISEFKNDMRVQFSHIFVPTRLATGRKLSQEIFDWYKENLEDCSEFAVRESTQGEEATAMRVSVPEYAPTSRAADEMRALIADMWLSATITHPEAKAGSMIEPRKESKGLETACH